MRTLLLVLILSGLVQVHLCGQGSENYAVNLATYRKAFLEGLRKDPRSPLPSKKLLRGIHFFPADQRYQVEARITLTPEAKPFDMPTYSGITKPYVAYGKASFTLADTTYELTLYRSAALPVLPQFRDLLFLPFKDLTNGDATYGGGRYLNLRSSAIADGRLEIDFNEAYNPWCAYSDGYNCPIPPVENHLPIPIPVGEKQYQKPGQ